MNHIVYWLKGKEHAELAKLSIASVRKVDPYAKIVVYTDEPDSTPHIEGTERRLMTPGRPAMIANLDAQVNFMLTTEHSDNVLFLDSDIIMRWAFPFDSRSDLYVTWRDHEGWSNGEKVIGVAELMPYNYGVVGASVNPRSIEAFIWLRARIIQMGIKYQNWYGNQMALADLCGRRAESGSITSVRKISWHHTDDKGTPITITQLPCEIYNYTPEKEYEDITGKYILHFKGNRKDWMKKYAEAI